MVSKLQRGDVQGAVATLRAALKALSDEGLDALAADVYEALARIYWVVNQKKEARKLARLAVESRADWGGRLAPVDIEAELREMVRAFDDE